MTVVKLPIQEISLQLITQINFLIRFAFLIFVKKCECIAKQCTMHEKVEAIFGSDGEFKAVKTGN